MKKNLRAALVAPAAVTLLLGASVFSGLGLTGPAAGAQPSAEKLAYGKHLAQECSSCHRADARAAHIPPLAGLEPEYFTTTMKFYKTGARDNPVMNSVAQALNDEQIEALAAYFATQKAPPKQAPRKK